MTSQLRLRSIAKGLVTLVPFGDRLANRGAGAPVDAHYFYGVWLRHLVAVQRAVPGFRFDVVGELGPGDALGIGLCALLSGARRYIGLDRLAFALKADNVRMLHELHRLFVARAPIPDDRMLPAVYPRLDSYAFPSHILDEARLEGSLAAQRLRALESALHNMASADANALLGYAAPWDAATNVEPSTVDLLLSQAVLEHVDDVESAYATMCRWLRPDGVMSHRIDYSSHGITRDWYGQWLVSESAWRVARGRRAYFINRLPHSAHLAAMRRSGLDILVVDATRATVAAPAGAMRVAHQAEDLDVKGALVIARRREA
jgi:hypothetical protein